MIARNEFWAIQIPDSPPDYRTLSKDKVRFCYYMRKCGIFCAHSFFDDNPDENYAFLEITVVWISFSMRSALSRRIACVRCP